MADDLADLRPEHFSFSTGTTVRFRDLDAMGHVNNSVYATYFEEARSAFVRHLGLAGDGADDLGRRFPFIVLDLYCRFLAPITLDHRLVTHLRTSHIGTKSFVFDYLVTTDDGRTRLAVGRTTQVHYDYASGRTTPLPDALRALLDERRP